MRADPLTASHGTRRQRRQPSFRMSTGQMGLIVLLISLSVLFAATLLVYIFTRYENNVWRTDQVPGLPIGLFASTTMILCVSASLHRAMKAIRANQLERLEHSLMLTLLFAVGFLGGQTFNWIHMSGAQLRPNGETLYIMTFFLLTGLHAVHVLGGFIPLSIVTVRARRREYSSSHCEGIKLCAQYWHFLAIVWLVMLTTMFVVT